MSIYQYLELQPLEPSDDDTVSDLDQYDHDETIDLNEEIDEEELDQEWNMVINDLHEDPEKLTFTEE